MTGLDRKQKKVYAWVETRLGKLNQNKKERALRFLEESLELVQTIGVTESDIFAVLAHVYSKPQGETAQEIGGVGVTLLALSEATGISFDWALEREITRIHTSSPKKFRDRQDQNVKLGIGLS